MRNGPENGSEYRSGRGRRLYRTRTSVARCSPDYRILMAVAAVLVSIGAAIPVPAEASLASGDPDLESRLETWNRGAELLDSGENEQASAYFFDRLRDRPGHLEIVSGFLQACQRHCKLDSALAVVEGGYLPGAGEAGETGETRETRETGEISETSDPAAPCKRFLAGERLKSKWRFAEAATEFQQAADISKDRGDFISEAVSLLATANCLWRIMDAAGAESATARARERLADLRGAGRLLAEAGLLVAIGHNLTDHLAEADSVYRVVLSLAGASGYRRVKCDCLNGLGVASSKRRRFEESMSYYRQALVEADVLADSWRRVAILRNLGYEETEMRKLDQARPHLEEAERLARACGFQILLGYVQVGLGAVAEAAGDRLKAVDFMQKAIATQSAVGNDRGELTARQRLAYNLVVMGEYSRAAAHYERCLDILRELESLHILHWVLGGLAGANFRLGYLEKAEEYFRRALEVARKLGDRMSAAWCLDWIGLLHTMRGQYRQALVYSHEARSIFEEIDHREGVGGVHASIAEVYYHVGDYNRSLEHYQQAFAIAQDTGFEGLLRSAAKGMALVYSAIDRPDLAEEYHLQSLAIARRWNDRVATIWALNDLAAHQLTRDRKDRARQYLDEAVALLESEGQFHVRSHAYLLLGRSAESAEQAIVFTGRALAAAEAGCLPEREWNCLSDLGEFHLAVGDTARGREFQLHAVQAVESIRRSVGTDELRRHLLRPAIVPYERMVDLLLAGTHDSANVARAFAFSERSRAQILASRLRVAYAQVGDIPAQQYAAEERDILSLLGYLQSRLQDSSLPAEERQELQARIDKLEEEFSLLRIRMGGQDNEYAAVIYPEVESPEELLSTLRPNERMLSYFLGSHRSYLFSAADGLIVAYQLPPRAEIEEKVRLFLSPWWSSCSTQNT